MYLIIFIAIATIFYIIFYEEKNYEKKLEMDMYKYLEKKKQLEKLKSYSASQLSEEEFIYYEIEINSLKSELKHLKNRIRENI